MRRLTLESIAFRIKYNGKDLKDVKHPALQEKSAFVYSPRLRDLNAAQAWGMNSPEEFDTLPKRSRIDIIAWYNATNTIKSIAEYDRAEKAKQDARANRKKGSK